MNFKYGIGETVSIRYKYPLFIGGNSINIDYLSVKILDRMPASQPKEYLYKVEIYDTGYTWLNEKCLRPVTALHNDNCQCFNCVITVKDDSENPLIQWLKKSSM
jgi:hypothetical protein